MSSTTKKSKTVVASHRDKLAVIYISIVDMYYDGKFNWREEILARKALRHIKKSTKALDKLAIIKKGE